MRLKTVEINKYISKERKDPHVMSPTGLFEPASARFQFNKN